MLYKTLLFSFSILRTVGLWFQGDATRTRRASQRLAGPRVIVGVALFWIATLQLGAQNAATSVTVDASAGQRAINPNIYGLSVAGQADIAALNAPLNRLGGETLASTYNWQIDALNLSHDWYFTSYLQDSPQVPGAAVDNSIQATYGANVGSEPMVSIPMMPYIANLGPNPNPNTASLWSYSVAKYGAQEYDSSDGLSADDPFATDAGSGLLASTGEYIVNNPLDAYVPNSVSIQSAWLQHLIGKWGLSTTSTGVKYYILDNEPSLWNSTHRDIHPNPETYEEEYNNIVSYAAAIRSADPNAKIIAPEEWVWWAMFSSGLDQMNGTGAGSDYATHNDTYYYPWLLQQLYTYEQNTGTKLIDGLSVHCYNQEPGDSDDSASGQATRNRYTRILWDPTYSDPSWEGTLGINGGVEDWIPLMRNWVNTYYPGLEIGCTEYNWGDEGNLNGATAQADVEGIYGVYGFDFATRWTVPANPGPTYLAMEMYRNYDGKLSTFGNTSVSAAVANPDNLSAYAATRSSDGALTVMVINKQTGTTPVTVNLANFANTGTAHAYQLSSATQTAITNLGSVSVTSNAISFTAPSQSITLFVVPAGSSAPAITSVSPIVSEQTQTITITGTGFGTHVAYTGDSAYIQLEDSNSSNSGAWAAGYTGNGIDLGVSSWTDSQIVLTGFSGNYGTTHCIRPGDNLSISVWNAQTGDGPATYSIVASGTTDNCPTKITDVTPILSQQTQTFSIYGEGFGTQAAYTGDSNYIQISNTTRSWSAGYTGNGVTLVVSSWSDTQIVLGGFSGSFGPNHCIQTGDHLSVSVWNAQTGSGPSVYPVVATTDSSSCATAITSISPVVSAQTQTITIAGRGFGTQAAYTGDSAYIEMADSSGNAWAAGYTGNGIYLDVSSWTDSQIVLSGFSGNYGTTHCIRPGDSLSISVWNAQTGVGPVTLPFVASGTTDNCPPIIYNSSQIVSQPTQNITIYGASFGTQAAYTGDSNYIQISDTTRSWTAGHTGNGVTLVVSSWTPNQIVLGGFSGSYGADHCINAGDHLSISVWNAQSGAGPSVSTTIATKGNGSCAGAITSVTPIVSAQTQTITITGWGFGTQAAYTGDSNYIEFIDSTSPFSAGFTGNGVHLGVSSWTDSQIVLTGFSGSYGTTNCIRPDDNLSISVWNAQTGLGPESSALVAGGTTDSCAPKIYDTSQILPEQTQTISIYGVGFGTQAAYTGDSNYIQVTDSTRSWSGGYTGNGVTLVVSSWADSAIELGGFSGSFGPNHCIAPGDNLSISVWNAQTGAGPVVYPVVASSGSSTCP